MEMGEGFWVGLDPPTSCVLLDGVGLEVGVFLIRFSETGFGVGDGVALVGASVGEDAFVGSSVGEDFWVGSSVGCDCGFCVGCG